MTADPTSRPTAPPTSVPVRRPKRRRRRAFSLNGLAIQVSAFALSFTLVALLVVGSSKAAFVEENETVTERVPVAAPVTEPVTYLPAEPARPTPSKPTGSTPTDEPAPTPAPQPEPVPLAQLTLTDDAAGTAMFADDSGLLPGVAEQRCIRVTLDGNVVPEPVRLYGADVSGALAEYLDLVVEVGPDGGVFGDCSRFGPESQLFSGTLAEFGGRHSAFDSGLAAWAPVAPGESRSFRFTVTVRDEPEAQGLSAGFGFSWEARAAE
jgi:hypothetical protein